MSLLLTMLATSCSQISHQSAAHSTQANTTFQISGPSEVRSGNSVTYVVLMSNVPTGSTIWEVNGIVGGESNIGTISQEGEYQAPLSPATVTISATNSKNGNLTSSIQLSVLNPIPTISLANVTDSSSFGAVVDVIGNGFVPGSTIYFNESLAPTTYVTSSDLRAQLPQAQTNSAQTALVMVSNPGPGSSDSNSISLALPASPLRALTGCLNPNTGTPTNVWGTAPDPVYADLNAKLIGTPLYAHNVIYWTSHESAPGQSVLIVGAFTAAQKTVKVALIPDGTVDWQELVHTTGTVVTPTQQGTTGLSFVIPVQFTSGVYGFEIDDPTDTPLYGLANSPEITWAIGIPSSTGIAQALQSQVHDCAVEQGETLRVFGKNFQPTDNVILESTAGDIISLSPAAIEPTSIAVYIPAGAPSGTYFIWVGSYPWDATSSPISSITILPQSPVNASTDTCPSLVGDGITDNAIALQACLDQAAPSSGSSQTAFIQIPSGVFALSSGVTIRSHEVLYGSSASDTRFVGVDSAVVPPTLFVLDQYAGMANLSVSESASAGLVASAIRSGDPTLSGHTFISGCAFQTTGDDVNTVASLVSLSGPDIQVYNSSFTSTYQPELGISNGDGGVISGNVLDDTTVHSGIGMSQNMIMESNVFDAASGPNADGATAITLGRPFCAYCNSYVERDIYIGHNTFDNMGAVDTIERSIITEDGGGGAYYGYVATMTAESVTLANDPSWIWTGDTNPESLTFIVISGTGVGEYATVSSYSGRVVNLAAPLPVPLDSTSVVEIVSATVNLTVADNEFMNTTQEQIVLENSFENVIEDNTLTNAGKGIQVWAYGPYGGPAGFNPVVNTEILRNTIQTGAGNLIVAAPNSNTAGIGSVDNHGCLVSGLLIRGNVLPPIQTIFDSNGDNGINANLIEQNTGIWEGPENDVQFLVQDNLNP